MRKGIQWLCVSGLCMGVGVAQPSPWVWHDVHQQTVSASTWAHHWVFIHYWAAWCHVCASEVPAFNAFFAAHQKQGVLVYGVNYDGWTGNALRQAVVRMGITYPVLQEDPGIAFAFQDANVLPETFVINPAGKVVARLVGPQTE